MVRRSAAGGSEGRWPPRLTTPDGEKCTRDVVGPVAANWKRFLAYATRPSGESSKLNGAARQT